MKHVMKFETCNLYLNALCIFSMHTRKQLVILYAYSFFL